MPCSECGSDLKTASVPAEELEGWGFEMPNAGTPHHELLKNNAAPGDAEIELIHSAISKSTAHLSIVESGIHEITAARNRLKRQLDEEISRLDDRLCRLRKDCSALQGYRTQNRATLSPLRRVPPEVWSEIFSWTLLSPKQALLRRRLHVGESPWVLTHVCRLWRTLAISDPCLWRTLAISYDSESHPSSSYPMPMIETHLARASKLDLHFFGSESVSSAPQIEVFRLLVQHAAKWETLRGRLPSLRTLWIQWELQDSQAADSIDCFEAAPLLVDAGACNEYRFVPISWPAQQLTRYDLDAPWTMHREILTLATNLTEARINVKFDVEPWPESREIIEIPLLRRLYVSTSLVFPYIQVPALDYLALSPKKLHPPLESLIDNLQSLLARSSCALPCLCLSGHLGALSTINIIQSVPSVTELRLVISKANASHVRALMEHLTVSEALMSTAVVPKLCCISFGYSRDSWIDFGVYLKMLKSRWEADDCALVKSVLLLQWTGGPGTVERNNFDALRREGMDLTFEVGMRSAASDIMNSWLCQSIY
ncbi:hypothetical protein DFH06DRAFT_1476269 [Mycena polygramma]|nr:hypothetical protein DFH06DRAFT_1476269 [Mycena polygramma]